MQAEFWLQKWQKQETGFHLDAPHPLLQKFHRQLFDTACSVFVPLCGKSLDIMFLVEQGYPVIGCELSQIAVDDFFDAQQMAVKTRQTEGFKVYTAENLQILQGDYFELQSAQLTAVNAIYDRASLVALPQALRKKYVMQLKKLCRHAKMLLISLEYPQQQMSGPPFSVSSHEITGLFDFASVKSLYRENILQKQAKFVEKGLTEFYETAYSIQW